MLSTSRDQEIRRSGDQEIRRSGDQEIRRSTGLWWLALLQDRVVGKPFGLAAAACRP
jgi:hypothetical protein